MPPSPTTQRHRALFELRTARLSKLLFGTLLFGGLATWKVTVPSVAQAAEHARASRALAEAEAALRKLEPVRAGLSELTAALESASGAIREAPWRGAVDELKGGFARLREANELYTADWKAVQRHFALRAEELGEAGARPATQAPPVEQVPPIARERRLDLRLDDSAQLARRKLDAAGVALDPRVAETARGATSRAELEPAFRAALDGRAIALADEAVERIVALVREVVRQPVASVLERFPALAGELPQIGPALDELGATLDRWRQEHLERRDWYATVDAKEREINDLGAVLDAWGRRVTGAVGPAKERLEATATSAAQQITALGAERTRLETARGAFEASVQSLLPGWIRGFVTVPELVRFLPFILVTLAGLIAAGAALVRHHHLKSRDELYPEPQQRRDPALSSCWTLADRGFAGTLWSSISWCAVAAAWWLATSIALRCAAAAWNDPFFGAPPFGSGWLHLAKSALVVVPALVGVGIVAAWRDVARGATSRSA